MVMAVNTGDGIYDDNRITRDKLFSENFRTAEHSACSQDILINDWFSGKSEFRRRNQRRVKAMR
jgi:hypothetical protein